MIGAPRAYVDRPVAGGELARAAAACRVALADWGVTASPVLLRAGMNALFVLDGDPTTIVRVGHANASATAAHDFASFVGSVGVATVVPRTGWAADIDGFAVTAWHRVAVVAPPSAATVDWEALGAAVRRVHALPPHSLPDDYPVPSPTVLPWWDFDTMMTTLASDVDDAARRGLVAAIERHADWRTRVTDDAVVCHGDVHPGNVIAAPAGALLIDWDLACQAAPAWDHAMLLTLAPRWGGDPGVYPAFASGYGRSFTDDPLANSLAELRNVAATLLRVGAARHDPAAAVEAERRLRFWRGDPAAPTWRAQ